MRSDRNASSAGHESDRTGRRLIIVLNDFQMGGSERQALRLARGAQAQGFDVVLVGLSGPGPLAEECRRLGLDVGLCVLRYPLSLWRIPAHLVRFTRFLRRLRPHAVVSYTSVPNLYGALAWRRAGARAFIWNQRSAGLYRPPRLLEKLAVARAPAFIANSRPGADFLERELGIVSARVHLVHNGVEMPARAAPRNVWRSRLGLRREDLVACMIGNVRPPKDHETLLQAWKIVRDVFQAGDAHAFLWIAGRTYPEHGNLEKRVSELGLEHSVRILVFQPDVYAVLAESDLGVFCSRSEGMPNGVLECMASRLPLVATDLPGVRECLPEKQLDYLVPVGDPQAVADKIVGLLGDEAERNTLGALNATRIQQQFSVGSMVEKTLGIIEIDRL